MRKTILLMVATLVILGIASSVYAKFWGWEITTLYSWESWKGEWELAGSLNNVSPYTTTLSQSFSSTSYVRISACVGLDEVIEARIGYEAGQQITRTYTISVSVPPYSKVYIYERWWAKYYCGSAVKYEFWEIVDAANWSACVPKSLHYEVRDTMR
ncbi:MAG: hypothetical protein PWP37_1156 [Thermotogota bacterium]|nr:hypothetical protein [Thermotogota bacterium]MDK2864964.1 hypothetical protein [Thermotogota bacterium]HCZ07333.1 hypothetical protein [Thermotogota bacterium]